jgi:RND family efflux transporter MFP subunit
MNATPDCLTEQHHERHSDNSPDGHRPHRESNNASMTQPPRLSRLLIVILVIAAAGLTFGLVPRLRARHQVAADTMTLSQPTVAVVHPAPANAGPPLVLSGELKPATEASIQARVNGYVRRWLVDLGAKVEAGQVLAELDTPDTDRELSQARAQLTQVEAARDLAAATAKRWKEMLAGKTVSAQEADEKASDYELKKATVEAARANVQRLEEVTRFAKITAPFAGTITVRRLDVGELIMASEGRELYRLAETDKLRVFVRVPQNYARNTAIGQIGELTFAELPGRKFPGKVVRTAGALDPATRTLLTELEVENPNGEILAGSYAQVLLPDAKAAAALTLPANTLIYRAEGTQIALVENDRIALRAVAVGRDFGSAVEIIGGVTAGDRVVVNPSDALTEGSVVQVVEANP